MSKIVISN